MHLRYDDDFVEAAVSTAASGKRPGVPALQIRRFHGARERCYSVPDPDERNAAFFKLHLDWFREWGLEKLLLDLLDEFPLIAPALDTLAFRKARAKKDEAAELYVSPENGRSAVVAMRPERFERDEAARHFLRHEFMHLGDMVDPAFGYRPELRGHGLTGSQERIARERYRLLWDITIDGRLGREMEQARHRAQFDHAFCFWPDPRREEVFSALWTMRSPRHEALTALAADPRELGHTARPLPGGACPLCGFSTFHWAEPEELPEACLRRIERDAPGWRRDSGLCHRCSEIYTATEGLEFPPTVCL
jgi:hypothetical protein